MGKTPQQSAPPYAQINISQVTAHARKQANETSEKVELILPHSVRDAK